MVFLIVCRQVVGQYLKIAHTLLYICITSEIGNLSLNNVMDLVLVSCNEIKCTCPYLCIGDSWWGELQGSRTRWYIRMVTCCLLLKPQKCPATSAVTVHYLRWYPYHRSANAVLRLPLSHLTNVVQSYITEHLLDLACFM